MLSWSGCTRKDFSSCGGTKGRERREHVGWVFRVLDVRHARPAVQPAHGRVTRSRSDVGEILGVTQSAVSQHLAKFKAYGLVTVRRDNQTLFYRLADKPDVKMLRKAALTGIETE